MGCGGSTSIDTMSEDINTHVVVRNDLLKSNIVEEFVRLDVDISRIENMCPGPRLATVEAWIDHLQSKLDRFTNSSNNNLLPMIDKTETPEFPNGIFTTNTTDSDVNDIAKLVLNLGVLIDSKKAAAHEDFFANLGQTSTNALSHQFYVEIIDHARRRAKSLLAAYNELSSFYIEQDGIIASISGGTYLTSFEEMLDSQLEVARDVRDKLGCALEQWRTCGLLLKASAESASTITKLWKEVKETNLPRDKVLVVLDCRHNIQASIVSLECAQYSLPHVEIKFLSRRQILAVRHVNTYLLTDIADKLRYEHTYKVLDAYCTNIVLASNWLTETYNQTLKNDFEKAEEAVQGLAKTLRDHRIENFSKEIRRK